MGFIRHVVMAMGLSVSVRHVVSTLRMLDQTSRILWTTLERRVGARGNRSLAIICPADVVRILSLATFAVDSAFFLRWLRVLMSKIDFWSYKRTFAFFKVLLTYWARMLVGFGYPAGFIFIWRGKINIAGNGRTRTLSFKAGNTALSTVGRRASVGRTTVSTFTGVIGITLIIFF